MTDNPLGEIVEAGTTAFIAQCLEVPREIVPKLYDPPPFGAFVKVGRPAPDAPLLPDGAAEPLFTEDEEDPFALPLGSPPNTLALAATALPAATYALVYGASTSSLEPSRRPSALGFADEDEMRRQQPQIFELLRTEFSGMLVAYSAGDGSALKRHLPPRPPRIHSRVYACTEPETRMLTADLGFLRAILLPSGGALAGVPGDELAAACLRQARTAHSEDPGFLLRAGRALAMLLADDYDRLQAILRSIAE